MVVGEACNHAESAMWIFLAGRVVVLPVVQLWMTIPTSTFHISKSRKRYQYLHSVIVCAFNIECGYLCAAQATPWSEALLWHE